MTVKQIHIYYAYTFLYKIKFINIYNKVLYYYICGKIQLFNTCNCVLIINSSVLHLGSYLSKNKHKDMLVKNKLFQNKK